MREALAALETRHAGPSNLFERWTLSWTNCYRWLGALLSPANDKETRIAAIECGPGGSYEEEGARCLICSRSDIASGHAAPRHRHRHLLRRQTQDLVACRAGLMGSSVRLAGRQAKTRQVELAVLRVPQLLGV